MDLAKTFGLEAGEAVVGYVREKLELVRLGPYATLEARLDCERRAEALTRAQRRMALDVIRVEGERVLEELRATSSSGELYARDRRQALRVAVNSRLDVAAAGDDPDEVARAREILKEVQGDIAALRRSRPDPADDGQALAVARVAGTLAAATATTVAPDLTPEEVSAIRDRERTAARTPGAFLAAVIGLDGEEDRVRAETEATRLAVAGAVMGAAVACCAGLRVTSRALCAIDALRARGWGPFSDGVARIGRVGDAEAPFVAAMVELTGPDGVAREIVVGMGEELGLRGVVARLDVGERRAYRATLATMPGVDAGLVGTVVRCAAAVAAAARSVALATAFEALATEWERDEAGALGHLLAEVAFAR